MHSWAVMGVRLWAGHLGQALVFVWASVLWRGGGGYGGGGGVKLYLDFGRDTGHWAVIL